MHFQVDEAALDDPRYELVAAALGITDGDAFKACCRIWRWLYRKGGGVLTPEEVDKVARQPGLAQQLVIHKLADAAVDGLRIHGDKRAKRYGEFVERQKARSKKGVEARKVVDPTIDNPPGNPSTIGLPNTGLYTHRSLSKGSSQSPESLELADYLARAIQEHTPSHKGNPERWAKDIDLAMRVDGRTPEELRSVVDYAHRSPDGSFWRSNILSGEKLRKQAERLLIARQSPSRGSTAGWTGTGRLWDPADLARAAVEQRARERAERGDDDDEPQ